MTAGVLTSSIRPEALVSGRRGCPATDAKAVLPVTETAPDARDTRLAAGGDREAFDRLVDRHQAAVARLLWRFTRDREDHAELVQEAFCRAWSDLPGYRGRGELLHWLRRIAVRVGYDHWRRLSRQRVDYTDRIEELADEQRWSEAAADAVVAGELVHGLLARLSHRDRLVLSLLYLEGCSVAEAAALTGWSVSLVKVQAHRARGRLRKLLAAEGDDHGAA